MGEGTEILMPQPPMIQQPPGTTTISTIAVRAEPHSTVVVAILKSIGFVELRIDEMRPGLLQIGATPNENAQLLVIHDDLYNRLISKQQQVEEVLGRAEQLVQEQTEPDDVLVYEAMSDGLATAWKGLNSKLAMRGYILADTQRLYEIALKHEELSKLVKSRITHDAEGQIEIHRIIDELADLTREGLETGSGVIAQIRLLGTLADNAERPRDAFDSCLAIEKIMLRLAQSWELIEGVWREQRNNLHNGGEKIVEQQQQQLQETVEIRQFVEHLAPAEPDHQAGRANLEAAEHWLVAARHRFEQIRQLDDPTAVDGDEEEMELKVLVNEIRANQISLKTLLERYQHQQTRCEQLLELYNRFLKEVQQREDLLLRTRAMLQNADTLLQQLTKMRAELRDASAAMAGELGPLAQQKGVALIEESVQLDTQWEREPTVAGGGGGVRVYMQQALRARADALKEAVIEVVQQARERIAAGRADKLRDKLLALEHWLHSVAGPVLAQQVALGPGAAETSEFLGRHRRFSTDLTLQKLSRELDTSLHFLSTLVAQQQDDDDDVNIDATLQQMRNLLQQANEHIYRERHQVDKFISLVTSIEPAADPNLDLQPAVQWSRNMLNTHEKALKHLQAQCAQWEQQMLTQLQQRRTHAPADAAPSIMVGLPGEQNVVQGMRLEMRARVQSVPDPFVEWFKDGERLTERTGHCRMGWLNDTATLVIEEVHEEDAGEYALVARNAVGQAQTQCALKVQPATVLTSKSKVAGQVHQKQEQQSTVVTTITSTTRYEEQQNGDAQSTEEAEKPRFVCQLTNVSVSEGTPFTLDCVVVGKPEPKIIWYREEQTLRESDRVRLAFRGDHCTLTCSDARGEDAGLYKVLAVNKHGETMNFCRVCIVPPSPKRAKVPPPTPPKPATPILARRVSIPDVIVQPEPIPEDLQAPTIDPQLCSQLVREGQSVHFQVQIRGVPEPEVRWFFNQNPIQAGDRPDMVVSKGPEQWVHSMSIPNVTLEHAGQYAVEAKNEAGELRSMATLNVLLGLEGGGTATTTETTTRSATTATTSPTSGIDMMTTGGFDSPMAQIMMAQHQQPYHHGPSPYAANFVGQHQNFFAEHQQTAITDRMVDQRCWSQQSGPSPQGIVYTVSRSERAESRPSSELGDPGYSSLANAPEFIRPFQSEVTINEGETAEVDCLMIGNPRPKVQWFFNDSPLRSTPNFVEFSNIGDTYTIKFPGARLECAGFYRLVADNVRGRAESRTLVHVRPKSMIPKPAVQRRSLGGTTADRGVQALLRMQRERQLAQQQKRAFSTPPRRPSLVGPATQSSTTSAYSPYYQQQQFSQPADFTTMALSTYDQQPTWAEQAPQIVPATSRCNQLQQLMTDTQQIRHRTPPQPKGTPPHFLQTLVSVVVAEGHPAKFEAIVTGTPEPRVDWSKDGQPLVEGANLQYGSRDGHAFLVVGQAGQAEVGRYCCSAENQFGMASSSAQLVLRPKTIAPDFVSRLISEEVEEGAPLKWTVRISGEPMPDVSWLRDGKPIKDGQEGVRLVQHDDDPSMHTLLIGAVMTADAGQFTCVLSNAAGEARSTADLVVRRKGTAPGKYVHVAKVSQERQLRGEEIAQCETVVVKGPQPSELSVDVVEEEEEDDKTIEGGASTAL